MFLMVENSSVNDMAAGCLVRHSGFLEWALSEEARPEARRVGAN